MSENEFWESTPRYLSARLKALEMSQQQEWERARYISFHVIKTVDAKGKFKKPDSLGKFPWEVKNIKYTHYSISDLDEFSKEADEILKKTNPEAYAAYMAGKESAKNG
jgi:hypothetical protein